VKIQLPDGNKVTLDEKITIIEKLKVVEDLAELWMPIIRRNWDSNTARFFIDGLANYLVWHKEIEDAGKEDKDVLSIKKVEQMVGKRQSPSIPFTSLSNQQKELLFGEVLNND
jgi:hypothetical protein